MSAPCLSDLPAEILGLVLQHLEVGRAENRCYLGTLATSCKALKLGIAQCSLKVSLRGWWTADQLAGLFRVLLELVGFGPEPTRHHGLDSNGFYGPPVASRTPAKPIVCTKFHFEAILACQKIRCLDLRLLRYTGRKLWDGIDMRHRLPPNLLHLALPPATLPAHIIMQINRLTGLTSLDCLATGFFPGSQLLNLKCLSAGGCSSAFYQKQRDSFCHKALKQLTNLTSLHLVLQEKVLPGIAAPPGLLDLTLWGYIRTSALVTLLGSLPFLQSLELKNAHDSWGNEMDGEVVTLPQVSTCIRRLIILDLRVDLGSIPTGNMRELQLKGDRSPLDSGTLAWLSELTSIQRLDLSGWQSSEEMWPLGQLPIQEFVSDQGLSALWCMLGPGALQNLRVAELTRQYGIWRDEDGSPRPDQDLAPEVAGLLLALPSFTILRKPWAQAVYSEAKLISGWSKATVELIRGLQPERWECLCNDDYEVVYKRL